MRSIPFWAGTSDDAKIPDRVKLRVFERGNRTCFICGRAIRAGDGVEFHHILPLADGGLHQEDNLASVHARCHIGTTRQEARSRSKARSTVFAHYLKRVTSRPLRSRSTFSRWRGE